MLSYVNSVSVYCYSTVYGIINTVPTTLLQTYHNRSAVKTIKWFVSYTFKRTPWK